MKFEDKLKAATHLRVQGQTNPEAEVYPILYVDWNHEQVAIETKHGEGRILFKVVRLLDTLLWCSG